jgi:hypothetical protein
MANLLAAKRPRVFNTLIGWIGEYPLYRRDERDARTTTNARWWPVRRCWRQMHLGYRLENDDTVDGAVWGAQGRSSVTGY